MQAATLDHAQRELPELIVRVVDDADLLVVCTDTGKQVVFVSLEVYESWQRKAANWSQREQDASANCEP